MFSRGGICADGALLVSGTVNRFQLPNNIYVNGECNLLLANSKPEVCGIYDEG